MWIKFTELSRKAILFAQNEANQNRSDFVCVVHLIYGVLCCEVDASEIVYDDELSHVHQNTRCDVVAQLMQINNVNVARLNEDLKRLMAHNDGIEGVEPTLTKGAKRVLELAAEEARRARCNYIGPEHLLLGALRFPCPVSDLLEAHNLNLALVRRQLSSGFQNSQSNNDNRQIGEELKAVLENSRQRATLSGCGHVSSAHLLLGVLDDRSVKDALRSCGVMAEKLQHTTQERLASDKEIASAQVKYTHNAKRVLDLAEREAMIDASAIISPAHLLLALARPDNSLRTRYRNLMKPPYANEVLVQYVLRDLPIASLREIFQRSQTPDEKSAP